MSDYEEVSKLYYDCISSSIVDEALYSDFFHAVGGILSNNKFPTEKLNKKLKDANDNVQKTAESSMSLIKQFMQDICSISNKENMTDIYDVLSSFLGELWRVNVTCLREIRDYRFSLIGGVTDIVVGAEIDRIMQNSQDIRGFIRYCMTEGYTSVDADEELIIDFLYNLKQDTESEVTQENAIILTQSIKQLNVKYEEPLNTLAVKFGIEPIVHDQQIYQAINDLYNNFHDLNIDTQIYGNTFYDAVGDILKGNLNYDIDQLLGGSLK